MIKVLKDNKVSLEVQIDGHAVDDPNYVVSMTYNNPVWEAALFEQEPPREGCSLSFNATKRFLLASIDMDELCALMEKARQEDPSLRDAILYIFSQKNHQDYCLGVKRNNVTVTKTFFPLRRFLPSNKNTP